MLLILTDSISNRFGYIARLILKDMLGIDFLITGSTEEFNAFDGPKFIYSKWQLTEGLLIQANGLLTESTIHEQETSCTWLGNTPVLFSSTDSCSALPFDPFAASFFLVTRYEEYLPYVPDRFGRYPAGESIALKHKFLEIPVVHLWAGMVKDLLRRHFPDMQFLHPVYRYVPTIDVDHAWCYLGRNWFRTMGGIGRSAIYGRLNEIKDRFSILAGKACDPYDNYEFINNLHQSHSEFPLYFILFAAYGGNDNNVSVNSTGFRLLLKELDQHGRVGIHPSLESGKDSGRLTKEFLGLWGAIGRKVVISRQHFLKISMPDTYRGLLTLGISDDYSMGYATHTGFRAGMAIPFPFFDLLANEVTPLVVHPVALMDVTMKDYLRLTPVESLEKIANVIQVVRSVNGEFVSLWHNETLSGTGRWEGWREIYTEMVKLASS
jgi:hypothetical protein